jgi:putative membrane protein
MLRAAALGLMIAALGACRAEDRSGQALGTQPKGQTGKGPGTLAKPEPGQVPQAAFPEVVRILGMYRIESQAEVQAAQLAAQRATAPEVKAFAESMLRDHQGILADIDRLTGAQGTGQQSMNLADIQKTDAVLLAFQAASNERMERLQGLSGEAFDGAYMQGEPSRHVALVALAAQGERLATNPEITAFFGRMGLLMRTHRDLALAVIPQACGGSPPAPAGGH